MQFSHSKLALCAASFLALFISTMAGSSYSDRFHDGTPDFLRLEDPADRDAFRRWFTFVAEVEFFTEPSSRPPEIIDCSALVRFAYREALKQHDSAWAAQSHLTLVPALPSVKQYSWPHTPLGASLFRVRPGAFSPSDLHDGAFREFADASTLQRCNTFLVTRDVTRAQPGDLMFFRRAGYRSSFHTMIVIGRSQIQPGSSNIVVYDTGGDGTSDNMRRRTIEELLNYSDRQWQPQAGNPVFLGVYRWNILRTGD